ncbi:MAG: SGNH/GDSL hydrolase family protein [Planctomycetota bacterium]
MADIPKVLVIGDSISMGYTPHAARELDGEFRLVHCEGNAGDSERVCERLDEWLAQDHDAEVIYINCGLHDLKQSREDGSYQVPVERYRENLMDMARRLGETGKKVIWAMTTPVLHDRHRQRKPFDRNEADVQAYNAVARSIMNAHDIPISELHGAVAACSTERCVDEDGVHMTEEGNRILGQAVADDLRRLAR